MPNFITRKLEERFVLDTNNGSGPKFLFRINEDGTRSIALIEDIKSALEDQKAELIKKVEEIKEKAESLHEYLGVNAFDQILKIIKES